MTAEIIEATPEDARLLTDRIRTGIGLLEQLVAEAYMRRAWAALGYATWDEYCTREFGNTRLFRLPREERTETVASLRESGLSLRAIAAATNQSHEQVRQELSAVNSGQGKLTVGTDGNQSPRSGTGIDGRTRVYPPRPKPPVPEPVFDDDPPLSGTLLPPGHPKPAPVMLTLRTHTGDEVSYPQPQSKATFNQTDGDGISWANWSWNPVTGCLHGCDYCYARAIANRFADSYPAGFTPLFHHDPEHGYTRLDAPANTAIPAAHRDDSHPSCGDGSCDICAWRRVFVCSMADLYGRWVPAEWIEQVHASMLASPQWQYILLTKFPDRYVGLNMPPGAWVGTSVDEQKRVRIAERAFSEVDAAVKWLSLEPLREPLEFTDLSMFDWVVIGAQTETRQPGGVTVPAFNPPPEWVIRITHQAKEAGCNVHWKPNLRKNLWFDEYPQPRHAAGIPGALFD